MSYSVTLPFGSHAREKVQSSLKTAYTVGTRAVASIFASTANKTGEIVERHPRTVAVSGVMSALCGLAAVGEQVGKAGVAAFYRVSAQLIENSDQPAAFEVPASSSAAGWWGLGMLAAGTVLTALGVRSQTAKNDRSEAPPVMATCEYETATVMSIHGREIEYLTDYETWQEQTFSRPYRPGLAESLGYSFAAWTAGRCATVGAWVGKIRAAHAAQTQLSQSYDPFPQTTNYIGEPLLPVNSENVA